MEIYLNQVLLFHPDERLYEKGPTYQDCIEEFRKSVPQNSTEYDILVNHFNWLYFEMEPGSRFLSCHMSDFIGHMRLCCSYSVLNEPMSGLYIKNKMLTEN